MCPVLLQYPLGHPVEIPVPSHQAMAMLFICLRRSVGLGELQRGTPEDDPCSSHYQRHLVQNVLKMTNTKQRRAGCCLVARRAKFT